MNQGGTPRTDSSRTPSQEQETGLQQELEEQHKTGTKVQEKTC